MTSPKCKALLLWCHICWLFLHTQIGAKLISTRNNSCEFQLSTPWYSWHSMLDITILSLQKKCRTADPDWQNFPWSGKLSFLVIYKFWQKCIFVRQVSDLIFKTAYCWYRSWSMVDLGHYHCCWCTGSLHHQIISHYGFHCQWLIGTCLHTRKDFNC